MPSVPPPSTSCANVPVSGYVSTKFSIEGIVEFEVSFCIVLLLHGQTPGYPGYITGCTKFARYRCEFTTVTGTVAIF
jgi:hypothetical protein